MVWKLYFNKTAKNVKKIYVLGKTNHLTKKQNKF